MKEFPWIYEGANEDPREIYRRLYLMYKKGEELGIRVEPAPIKPNEMGHIGEEEVFGLEADIALLYSIGLNFFGGALDVLSGRSPLPRSPIEGDGSYEDCQRRMRMYQERKSEESPRDYSHFFGGFKQIECRKVRGLLE